MLVTSYNGAPIIGSKADILIKHCLSDCDCLSSSDVALLGAE